jgi:hypothetical protein
MTLVGGYDMPTGGLFVGKVMSGCTASPAPLAHDRVVAINGVSVLATAKLDNMKMLREAEAEVTLTVVRVSDEYHFSDASPIVIAEDEGVGQDKHTDGEVYYTVWSTKVGEMDFTIVGGSDHALGAVFVESVVPGSNAVRAGLDEGDRILDVNGIGVLGLTSKEAEDLLLSCHGEVKMHLVHLDRDHWHDVLVQTSLHSEDFVTSTRSGEKKLRNIGLSCFKGGYSKSSGFDVSGKLVTAMVSKNAAGKYGLSVDGGYATKLGGIFVTETPCDAIEVHDRILEVNGRSLLTASVKDFTDEIVDKDSFSVIVVRVEGKQNRRTSIQLSRPMPSSDFSGGTSVDAAAREALEAEVAALKAELASSKLQEELDGANGKIKALASEVEEHKAKHTALAAEHASMKASLNSINASLTQEHRAEVAKLQAEIEQLREAAASAPAPAATSNGGANSKFSLI